MAVTLEGLTPQTTFNDADIFHFRRPGTDIDYYITGLNLKSQIVTASNFVDVSSDKTINEGSGTTYFVTTGSSLIEFTMPAPATNKNSFYTIIKIDAGAGLIKINPAASETLGGISTVYLFQQTDAIVLRSDGVNWHIANNFKPYFKSGWINRSAWADVHLGFQQVTYDNLSGTFTIGEIVTEATSSNTGIIIDDTASVLTLVSVTGTGVFTNNRQLTGGTSSATADVNGDTKNVDSNVLHNWGTSFENINSELTLNAGVTIAEASKRRVLDSYNAEGTSRGTGIIVVDTNSFHIQAMTDGFRTVSTAGAQDLWATGDWFYHLEARLK